MDFVLAVDRLPLPGETILGRDFRMIPGGKGANQAYAAAKLAGSGTVVRMLGLVGMDSFGSALKANLAGVGVDVRGVADTAAEATGVRLHSRGWGGTELDHGRAWCERRLVARAILNPQVGHSRTRDAC